jgi:hypothetical protein
MQESKSCALPLGDIPVWGERWDSNPRQPEPQSGALPTELRPPYGAPSGTRTRDALIKSQVLYQLS